MLVVGQPNRESGKRGDGGWESTTLSVQARDDARHLQSSRGAEALGCQDFGERVRQEERGDTRLVRRVQ